MPVEWLTAARQLHLRDDRLRYVMRVLQSGALAHLHMAALLAACVDYAHIGRRAFLARTDRVTDPDLREPPTIGSGDDRAPALAVVAGDGSGILELVHREPRIQLARVRA